MVVKPRDSRFHSRFLVDERFKTKIQFNGSEYAAADEMPVRVRVAYERFLHETPVLHSGARLAAKLKATIIVNDSQFNHAGECRWRIETRITKRSKRCSHQALRF